VSRILVVEDDLQIQRLLGLNLTARGYEVSLASTGGRALELASKDDLDLVILDLGLPDLDGVDVIRALRAHTAIPIIVLSARQSSTDKVQALDLGANDYVSKPFDVAELLARVRAATRGHDAGSPTRQVMLGPCVVDLVAKTVERSGSAHGVEKVHLTKTEWHLLELLLRNPGRLLTHRELLTALRGDPDYTDSSYVRIYMGQLRRKLELDPSRPRHLITESGMGYRFQPDL
jgi:two-component system KDP operon response regulator KdpE